MTNLIAVKKYKSNRLADYTKLKHKNCPFCGSEMLSTVLQSPQVDRCTNCGQAFRQEIVPSNNIDFKNKSSLLSWWESRAASRHHYKFIQSTIGLETVDNLLEIGPGDGVLLRLIRRKYSDISISAIEPSREHCQTLSEIPDVTIYEDYIENIQFKRKFDLVIMSHVLEHIEMPLQTIKYIYDNLLTDGGILYIDIPNQDYELQNTEVAIKAPVGHLYFFNGADMPDLLARVGFSKNNFMGVKYKTLPYTYSTIMGWISKLEQRNINKYYIYPFKAINKLSLYAVLFFRNLFDTRPKEIPIDKSDSHYNNIAIAVRK